MKNTIILIILILTSISSFASGPGDWQFNRRWLDGSVGVEPLFIPEPASMAFFVYDHTGRTPVYKLLGSGIDCSTSYCNVTGGTGPQGAPGNNGASAYEIAVANGFIGTQAAWLSSLIGAAGAPGATGPKGDTGAQGPAGANGTSGTNALVTLTTTGSGAATYNSVTGALNIPTPFIPTVPVMNRAVVTTATDGTYTWTLPTACSGIPAVSVTPQNSTSAEVINHKITAVSATSVSISLSRAVLTLNGLLGLTIPVIQTSPGAQTVHLIAVCP